MSERTSTPLTLAMLASVSVADAANASVSVPAPPKIESLPSNVELAIEKKSAPDPPTNVVANVSPVAWVKVLPPFPPNTVEIPAVFAFVESVTLDPPVNERTSMPLVLLKRSFAVATPVTTKVSEAPPPTMVPHPPSEEAEARKRALAAETSVDPELPGTNQSPATAA